MRPNPKFALVVWIRKTDAFVGLHDELVGLVGDEPQESTSYEGMVDFHWGFSARDAAQRVAERLKLFSQKPEVVLLRLSSYVDNERSVTFKDERHVRH